ncbi:MAG: hypothetical protein ACTJHC_02405 [Vagococcus sp.]
MTVLQDRENAYQTMLYGDPMALGDFCRRCEGLAIVNNAMRVTSDTILVADLSHTASRYASLIVSCDSVPYVSEKTTLELMKEFDQASLVANAVIQQIVQRLQSTKHHMSAMVREDTLLIPLTGCVRKNTTFINYTMIDGISKNKSQQPVVTFFNHLELLIQCEYRTLKKRLETAFVDYLNYYIPTYSGQSSLNDISFTDGWRGRFIGEQVELIREVIRCVNLSEFKRESVIAIGYAIAKLESPDLLLEEFLENCQCY